MKSGLKGEDRPGLTAGIAGGLWTSWVRLWSASPWMPPPRTRVQPLAKEAQDKNCHKEQKSRRPGLGALSNPSSVKRGHDLPPPKPGSQPREGCRQKSRACPKAGITQGRAVFQILHCLSLQWTLQHSQMKELIKWDLCIRPYRRMRISTKQKIV